MSDPELAMRLLLSDRHLMEHREHVGVGEF